VAPAKSKREDKLPLERALRALEDVYQKLKEFSATDSVANNDAFAAKGPTQRQEIPQARDCFGSMWGRTFDF
jgi:hypothetical protein